MTYTPSFERARDLYSWALRWDAGDHEDRPDLAKLQVDQRAEFDRMIAAHDAEMRKTIAEQVRRNCTLPWPLPVGTDATVYAVADWIENPPEWVTAHLDGSE